MADEEQVLLASARLLILIVGLGLAAWMDYKSRRVPNEHWIRWSKPAIFIWFLELLSLQAHPAILLTASASIAFASGSVFGRPSIDDVRKGSKVDVVVYLWYALSIAGVLWGAYLYQHASPLDVLAGVADKQTMMWWQTLGVLFVLFLIDIAWRVRLLHGGADAKALMWATLVFPTWSAIDVFQVVDPTSSVVALPPSFSLLMWGACVFLLIPVIMLIRNIAQKNLHSMSDIRLAWHSTMIPIEDVQKRHVWMLTKIIVGGDGNERVYHASRAPKYTPSDEEVQLQIEKLRSFGIEHVWVSFKIPLLVFLFPAIAPLVLFGDPTGLVLSRLI